MSPSVFFIAVIGVLLNALAQLSIKFGVSNLTNFDLKERIFNSILILLFQPGIVAGLLMYAISVFIWMYVLSKVDVSIAYPLLSIGYVLNVFLAAYFFSEPITVNKIFGISLIAFGVYVLTRTKAII